MFELDLSEEQIAVRDLSRDFATRVLAGAARDAETNRRVPDEVWRQVFETGLTAPASEDHGGGGIPDTLTHLVALEGLATGDPGIAIAAMWSGGSALLVGLCGTAAQQYAYLPRLASDRQGRGGVALYEGFGRAPSEYQTRIEHLGSGTWQVAGTKVAVPFAAEADPLVLVGTDPTTGELRAALIPPDAGGVAIGPRPEHGHLGLDAVPLHTVTFDLTIGPGQLLGGPGAAAGLLVGAVGRLRLSVAAAAIGCAARSVEYAAAYANERIAFGKPLAAFQGVSFLLADAAIQIEACRLDLWRAGVRVDAGPIGGLERAVSHAVNYAGSVAASVTRDAVQVLGGHGFIRDHPVERWYRAAAALSTIDFDPTYSTFAPAL